MHRLKPGDTVDYKSAEWTIHKTEIRYDGKWALLVISEGTGKTERIVARAWVRWDEMEGK